MYLNENNKQNQIKDVQTFAHGQIFWYEECISKDTADYLRNCGYTIGSRPVIVVRNINVSSFGVTIIPLSTTKNQRNGVKLYVGDTESVALVTEIRNVPYKSLIQYMGQISYEKMREIDTVLSQYLGLNNIVNYNYFPKLYDPRYKFDAHRAPVVADPNSDTPYSDIPETCYVETTPAIVKQCHVDGLRPQEETHTDTVTASGRKKYCKPQTSFSLMETAFIKISSEDEIMEYWGCSYNTAKRRKKTADETFIKPITECQDVYDYFKGKDLHFLDKVEGTIFITLKSNILSTTLNIPLQTIVAYQKAARIRL